MHDNMMAKLLAKKAKNASPLSDNEKKAKMDVLRQLDSEMSSDLGDKLKDLKKVTVASDSEHGLQSGLDKAKEMLAKHSDEAPEESDENPDEEAAESPEEEQSENYDEMSPEELDQEIQKLVHLKKMKMMKA